MFLSRKNADLKREFQKVFKNAVFLYSYNKQRSLGEAGSGCEKQEKPRGILLHSLESPIVLILLPVNVRSCGCPVQIQGQRGVLRIPQSVTFTRPGPAGIMSQTGPQRGKKMTTGNAALRMLSVYLSFFHLPLWQPHYGMENTQNTIFSFPKHTLLAPNVVM